MCNFVPINGKSIHESSEKDCILTFATSKLYNLFPFIRTLRTTGSRCRVILFTNTETLSNYQKNYFHAAHVCGLEIINFGVSIPPLSSVYYRFLVFKDFLQKNYKKIDRVIIVDLYDTIFQHDPFTIKFSNSVYICDEGYPIGLRISSPNLRWTLHAFDNWKTEYDPRFKLDKIFKKNISKYNVLNAGLIAGKPKILIDFLSVMCLCGNSTTYQLIINDQGFLNALIHSGSLNGIFNYTVLKPNNDFFASISMYAKIKNRLKKYKPIFGRIYRDDALPAVLHQYDRIKNIKLILNNHCPNYLDFSDYASPKI